MGSKTKIEWCEATWNPVTGCLHGCEYCYARSIANRFGAYWESMSKKPVLNAPARGRRIGKDGKSEIRTEPYPYGFEPTFHRYRLDEPKKWPKAKTIFVCSMADLFGDWVPDEWIKEVFKACQEVPQHTYLFLTKNPKRLCDMARAGKLPEDDNFWYGSTLDCKNAKYYPGRITDHIFLSIEPLREYMDAGLGSFGSAEWIIIGAETGNRKNKVVPKKEWIENICAAADLTQAAVFMKDSLVPIVGEEHMRRELPWELPE